jgi:hypothetical protein
LSMRMDSGASSSPCTSRRWSILILAGILILTPVSERP